MKTIKKMDRASAKAVGAAITKALQNLELDGVEARLGNATFDEQGGICSLKVEVGIVHNGVAATKDSASYMANADLYDCDPEWLGEKWTSPDGKAWKIVGLNARKHERQILCECDNGKRYWMRPDHIIAGMRAQGKRFTRPEPDWGAAAAK